MARSSLLRSYVVLALWILFLALFLVHPATAHGGEDHDEDGAEVADEDVDLRASGLIAVKGYCLLIIFFATFLPGVSPYFFRWNDSFLVLGIQFATGVFFATAMLHFLPDSNETFEDLTTKTYPFAYLLAVSGYLITMLADVAIQSVVSREQVASSRALDVESADAKPQAGGTITTDPPEAQHTVKATLIHKASIGDAILLITALCFHSVFEGIAIGVSATKHDAWRNLWTITLHKVFAAISMGIALLRIMPNRPLLSCATYAFAFAISSPVGVGIGIGIDSTSQGATADWIYAISMGLAAGIFIYVAINHLLAKGYAPLSKKVRLDRPFFKFLAVTLGAGVIFVVMIWD